MAYIVEVSEILPKQGFVKSILRFHRLLDLRCHGLFTNKGPTWNGVHDEKGQRNDHPDCKDCQYNTFKNVLQCFGIHFTFSISFFFSYAVLPDRLPVIYMAL